MKTNRDKYEHYRQIIEAKDAEAIAVLLPNSLPEQFYRIEGYEAVPTDVTSLGICHLGIYKPFADQRMTKIEVEVAKFAAENWECPTLNSIEVFFSYKQKYGTVTGARSYWDLEADPAIAWSAEELQPEIERRRALYAPREGCKPCQYCQKQTPENDLIPHKIFYRNAGGSATKTGLYCSSQCGGYDQMGHEG